MNVKKKPNIVLSDGKRSKFSVTYCEIYVRRLKKKNKRNYDA